MAQTIEELQSIALTALNEDIFLGMSHEAQVLYVYLVMNADSTGYLNNAKAIGRMVIDNQTKRENAFEELELLCYTKLDRSRGEYKIIYWLE